MNTAEHRKSHSTNSPLFAIVDVETTGLYNSDRIVEIAIVTMNSDGMIINEFDTLINPERDVGPTHVHGITASMVSAAPTFREILPILAEHINNAVLVAHNLSFDTRMLINEFSRVKARLLPGDGVCTLRLTGEKLTQACKRYGIRLDHNHRALADARATADLFGRIRTNSFAGKKPANTNRIQGTPCSRTLRREGTGETFATPLSRVIANIRYPTSDGAVLSYLDGLDWVLDDLIITKQEKVFLEQLATELGITKKVQNEAHQSYMQMIVEAVIRDGIVTANEQTIMKTVASSLNIDDSDFPETTTLPKAPIKIAPGTRVCFTGTAVSPAGDKICRSKLEEFATKARLLPVSRVSKSGCDLVIASDAATSSSKAIKARKYGIPIMPVMDFLRQVADW